MNKQQLINIVTPQNTVNPTDINAVDSIAPYSFQAWLASHVGVIPGEGYQQYNQYLTQWYTNKNKQNISNINQVRLNYLNLLSQLQLFIPNEQLENWYNQINIQDERELLLAIPYYAKRLRDIALYYCKLRDTVKKTKLQYNLIGTNTGTTQEILNNIQSNFSQRPGGTITLPASTWKTIPQLSSIQDTINVFIEELYDFKNYLGQSPTVDVTSYFDLSDTATTNYFSTLGLTLSSSDWIYTTGNIDLTATNTADETTALLQTLLVSNTLGEDKYTGQLLYTNLSSKAEYFNIGIAADNNFFYWPSNPYESVVSTPRLTPLPIEQSGLTDVATAGKTIETADTVFIKTAKGVEGAWYRHVTKETKDDTMVLDIRASDDTIFKFPFSGFGLSGEESGWTGLSLSSTPVFKYLPLESKQAVEKAYWNYNTSLTGTNVLNLNETTLIENKAYANIFYRNADKIQIWQQPPDFESSAYSDKIQEAWLYAMHKTDIPIAGYSANTTNTDNTILWPLARVESNTNTNALPNIDKICNPIPLTGMYLPNATAGLTLQTSDVIYKLNNATDPVAKATECAWLSGSIYKTKTLSAVSQPGFNAYFISGDYTKFVWLGPDNTDISEVFKTINHEPDCKYVTTNSSYLESNNCTCRAVYFAPFGHPGENFDNNNGLCDIIVPDIEPFNPFNLSWLNDSNFAWYKTNTKIGWGDGEWVTNLPCSACDCSKNPPVPTKLNLKTGSTYVYGRANKRNSNTTKTVTQLPNLAIRYYFTNPYCKWVKARKVNNTWVSDVSGNEVSDMIFHPGDYLKFVRPNQTSFSVLSGITNYTNIAENHISIWSDYDFVTIGTPVTVAFPQPTNTDVKLLNQYDPYHQYPIEHFNNIVNYDEWSVTDPKGELTIFKNTGSFTFKPTDPGIYYFSLTATVMWHQGKLTTDNVNNTDNPAVREHYIFSCIPPVTAVMHTVSATELSSYNVPTPGYVINTPLQGWSYNMCAPDSCVVDYFNNGARPFWAVSYNEKTTETNYRSIIDWGAPQRWFDEHNCVTQPLVSPISLSGGEYFRYTRSYNTPMQWSQPLTLNVKTNYKQWCELEYNTLTLAALSSTLNNIYTNLVTVPLTTPSKLYFNDYINNQPCEVYYNAISPFTWNITATPILANNINTNVNVISSINTNTPWSNLDNRYFPTLAVTPYLGSLSSSTDVGDFFTSNKLGATYFIDQNYSYKLTNKLAATNEIFEDPTIHIGGRGLTKQDQITPYVVVYEDNSWLKEPVIAGDAAGDIEKAVARTYQKFIPYQSNIESNQLNQPGFVTTNTLQTPWGGINNTEWIGGPNSNFTGEINLSSWSEAQILTQTGKELDNWVTDIYNNEYGLFKNLVNVTTSNRKNVTGNIWVKTNNNITPASIALSSVYELYNSTFLYNQLIGNGVTKIDTFFNTLYVETTGAAFFNGIAYNYNNNTINTNFDYARCLSLALPAQTTLQRELCAITYSNFANTYNNFAKIGDTWFFPAEKKVAVSVCGLSSNNILPEIYTYDIINSTFKKVFPLITSDINSLEQLTACNITHINAPLLSYDEITRTYLLTILAKNNNNIFIIEIKLTDALQPSILSIKVYTNNTSIS